MLYREEVLAFFEEQKLIAVIRTGDTSQLLPLCRALVAGGIRALEITLTVPNALVELPRLRSQIPEAVFGVGTVLGTLDAAQALAAGADFIVTPVAKPEIARMVLAQKRVVMLGAYSPTEVLLAHESGADFVKIFPAETLGPSYIRSLLAPLPGLKIVPTGGIDEKNAAEFLQAGAALLGIGSSLVSPALIKEKNWEEISRRAGVFGRLVS